MSNALLQLIIFLIFHREVLGVAGAVPGFPCGGRGGEGVILHEGLSFYRKIGLFH